MSAPQVGDVVTTAEELDALPADAVLIHPHDSYPPTVFGKSTGGHWTGDLTSALLPATLVYLPGQPPRPERVVKAEALREAAATVRPREEDEPFLAGLIAINGGARAVFEYVKEALSERADDIERGDQ